MQISTTWLVSRSEDRYGNYLTVKILDNENIHEQLKNG